MDPVSRASAWRKGFGTPKDYDDSQGDCGGKEVIGNFGEMKLNQRMHTLIPHHPK
jgi:hypothetical protein